MTHSAGTTFPKLTIRHNHGTIVLRDAVLVDPYVYDTSARGGPKFDGMSVRGTVIGGGSTSRLFHATSHTPERVGEVKRVDLFGRWDSIRPAFGGSENGWQPIDGEFEVDLTSCG
jgi:hypothetical protein